MRLVPLISVVQEAADVETALQAVIASDSQLNAIRGTKLLELARYLLAQGPNPEIFFTVTIDELWLQPIGPAKCMIMRIGVDWRDYSPLSEGTHFRLRIDREGSVLTEDLRVKTFEEVERAIWQAFTPAG